MFGTGLLQFGSVTTNVKKTIKNVYDAAGLADKKEDAPQTKLPDMLNVIDAS